MEVVYLLVPIAIALALIVVGLFFWSIRSGQFDDLEGPAHRILMDDTEPRKPPPAAKPAAPAQRRRRQRSRRRP